MLLCSLQPCTQGNPGVSWWAPKENRQVLPGSEEGRDPQPARVRGLRFPMAPFQSQMAGEKRELPPLLSPIPAHSPPQSPPLALRDMEWWHLC